MNERSDEPAAEQLPSSHATRWYKARKAQVVRAVQNGLISLDEALVRYRLSLDEFRSWQSYVGNEGLRSVHARAKHIARGRRRKHRPPVQMA
jgi:hypothetical protein